MQEGSKEYYLYSKLFNLLEWVTYLDQPDLINDGCRISGLGNKKIECGNPTVVSFDLPHKIDADASYLADRNLYLACLSDRVTVQREFAATDYQFRGTFPKYLPKSF